MSVLCIVQRYYAKEHGMVPLYYSSEDRNTIMNSFIIHYDETSVDDIRETYKEICESYSNYNKMSEDTNNTLYIPMLAYANPETIGEYYISKNINALDQ